MRINSGVCRISGKTTYSSKRVVDDDIFIAFDYANHFYRFDNGKLVKALLTPDFYYEVWGIGGPTSVRRSAASDPRISNFCSFIDIQGVFHFTPVGPHGPHDYQKSVLHRQIKQLKKVSYKDMANGLVNVTIEYPNPDNFDPPLTATFTINKINGYTIQHIEYNCGYTMDISWKNINKTWVPVAYVFKSDFVLGVEWKLEWEQVNEKVDPSFFKLEELVGEQDEDVPIFSEELGSPPVIIGKISKGDESFMVKPKMQYYYFRSFLIVTGLIFIFVAFGRMGYDRLKRKRQQ
jgi:hypothetical protein